MGQLVVVRHGQASLMKADYDELSEQGRAQAAALGRHLAEQGWSFDAVFTGPARRHRDTAALASDAARARGRSWPPAVEVPQLDEHDAFGLLSAAGSELSEVPEVLEGQRALRSATSAAERSRSFQRLFEAVMHRWFEGRFEPEGVETWPQFRARVREGLDAIIASRARRAIAFSSVGPLAVVLQRALGTDDAASFRTAWRLRNASLTTFVFDEAGRFTLDGFNALPHLADPRTWTFR
ncbi:MAG: histidine phosphatase family protein [Myxococcales bacterium]|nr:histidine phosphatase family protein [Myxococcales bacterium]